MGTLKIIFLLIGLCLIINPASARKETVYGMKQDVYKALNNAQILIDSNESYKAMHELEKLTQSKISDYEHAHILNMIAVIKFNQDDLKSAVSLLKQAASFKEIPLSLKSMLTTKLVQMHLMMNEYSLAMLHAEQLITLQETPDPTSYLLATQAAYYLQNYTNARFYVEEALRIQTSNGTAPKENYLLMASAVYHALNERHNVINTQLQLLEHYPKSKYMVTIATLYAEKEEFISQLALLEALYDTNNLTSNHYLLTISNLFLLLDTPYKAATLLETELNKGSIDATQRNWERLATAWIAAGEYYRAIKPQQKAAQENKSGEGYILLANTLISLGEWDQAITAINHGLEKGSLKETGNALVLKGMTEYRLKHYDLALKTFKKAREFKKSERLANQWIQYLQNEVEKRNAVESL